MGGVGWRCLGLAMGVMCLRREGGVNFGVFIVCRDRAERVWEVTEASLADSELL